MSKFRFITSSEMRGTLCAAILALCLLGFPAPRRAAARAAGPSAEGSLKISGEDGLAKYVEFSAVTNADGSASGSMTLKGEVEIPDQDVDGAGREGFSGSLSDFYVEAKFDGLVVERNRALMSGTVTASNVGEYIGRRVLLVVEDNADDPRAQDAVAWGLYKPAEEDWVPSDAELKEDPGVGLTWWATDAELKDDKGVSSEKSKTIDCQTFPLSSYTFDGVKYESGDVRVQS